MKIASKKSTDKHLKMYCTNQEYERIKAVATDLGISASLFARNAVLQHIDRIGAFCVITNGADTPEQEAS